MNPNRSLRVGRQLARALVGWTLLNAPIAWGESHAYLNAARSGASTSVFLQEGVSGEYGTYQEVLDGGKTATRSWQGYGLSTTAGLELNRFVQFVAGHTSLNLRANGDDLERLSGSRLHGGLRLSFSSPVGNLEFGGGFTGSRLDYQRNLETASFYGSGKYYSIGINYFLTSHLSVYSEVTYADEHLLRSSGVTATSSLDTNSNLGTLGFRIWL